MGAQEDPEEVNWILLSLTVMSEQYTIALFAYIGVCDTDMVSVSTHVTISAT